MLRLEVWKCKDWLEWNQFKRIYFASRSTRSEIAHRLMFFVCFAYCKNNEKFFSLSTKIGKKHGKLISCQYKTTFMKLWMQQCYECIHSNRQNISSRWNSMRRKILLTFPALRGIYELAFSIHNCWIVFCVRLWIRRRRWLHRTFHDLFNMISHFVNRKAKTIVVFLSVRRTPLPDSYQPRKALENERSVQLLWFHMWHENFPIGIAETFLVIECRQLDQYNFSDLIKIHFVTQAESGASLSKWKFWVEVWLIKNFLESFPSWRV